MGERGAGGDAAAQADDADRRAAPRWSSSGRCASSFCVSMSPAFEASTLPLIASEISPATRRTDTVPGRAVAVVEQRAGIDLDARIEAGLRRLPIEAGGEQRVAPWRRRATGGCAGRGASPTTADPRARRESGGERARPQRDAAARAPRPRKSRPAARDAAATGTRRRARRQSRRPCSTRRPARRAAPRCRSPASAAATASGKLAPSASVSGTAAGRPAGSLSAAPTRSAASPDRLTSDATMKGSRGTAPAAPSAAAAASACAQASSGSGDRPRRNAHVPTAPPPAAVPTMNAVTIVVNA